MAREKFQKLKEAYEILMDQEKRKQYDQTGTCFLIEAKWGRISMKAISKAHMSTSAKCSKKSLKRISINLPKNIEKVPWRKKIFSIIMTNMKETWFNCFSASLLAQTKISLAFWISSKSKQIYKIFLFILNLMKQKIKSGSSRMKRKSLKKSKKKECRPQQLRSRAKMNKKWIFWLASNKSMELELRRKWKKRELRIKKQQKKENDC